MTEINESFQINDGLREIFVNTAVDDGSAIAQLMQYFTTADPYDMTQGALSQQVNYYKVEQKGVRFMKSLSQQIYAEGRAETVLTYMQKTNCDLTTALNFFEIQDVDRTDLERIIRNQQQEDL